MRKIPRDYFMKLSAITRFVTSHNESFRFESFWNIKQQWIQCLHTLSVLDDFGAKIEKWPASGRLSEVT